MSELTKLAEIAAKHLSNAFLNRGISCTCACLLKQLIIYINQIKGKE
jgi:hypothetical protein